MKNPWIKLKETIDSDDFHLIQQLQDRCIKEDQVALKLELDYKLSVGKEEKAGLQDMNEFMFFDGDQLIGYIGICSFGGPWEVNGVVDPDYRRQGVFTKLFELVLAEAKRRNAGSMLLLSDRNSVSGQQFIAKTGASIKHSEFEMFLKEAGETEVLQTSELTFRKATNADAKEIAKQNKIYFGDVTGEEQEEPEDRPLPEEEEKRGMTCYLVEKDQQVIGKVNLKAKPEPGAIFGLGVLPEHRRKGYGRGLLLKAIEKLREAGAKDIMLQVEAKNANALNLYKSCGFRETSTMDYYELKK